MAITALPELIRILESQIGLREEKEDRGREVRKFQSATDSPPGKWPWCAAFVCWTLREWLQVPAVRAAFGLTTDAQVEAWRFRDTAAYECETWAARSGLKVLPAGSLARAGDIVVFTFSHIGFVVQDQSGAQVALQTIEGNTPVSRRRLRWLDGVGRKSRSPELVRCLIRLEKAGT